VRDRSQGGFCILCSSSYPEGSLLRVRVAVLPESTPWIEVRIAGCTQLGGRYLLHCEYLHEPPAELLALLP
jgi:hypothetical protein